MLRRSLEKNRDLVLVVLGRFIYDYEDNLHFQKA